MASDPRVRVTSRTIVKASGGGGAASPPHVLAVSNLDLLPQSVPVSLFCAYRKPSAFQARLPSLLNHFLPLTGRIAAGAGPRSWRPELHCDNQGAELVVGEVRVALASLDYGDLGASLARTGVSVPYGAGVELSVQLVSFACGGFAVAWGSNHSLVDGYSLCMLATAWSQLARSGSRTVAVAPRPNHDRSVFRPRAAPPYGSEVGEAFAPLESERLVNALTCEISFVRRTYYVEASNVGLGSPLLAVTSFRLDTDFGFGHAALAVPTTDGCQRLCCGFVQMIARPGWIVTMSVWPRLAAALDSDERSIFKPLTAEYLGLTHYSRL